MAKPIRHSSQPLVVCLNSGDKRRQDVRIVAAKALVVVPLTLLQRRNDVKSTFSRNAYPI